jgi:PAS domain S-box-containing protein
MDIDIRTLAIVLCITNVLQIFAILLQYNVNKAYQGIGWWALGFTSLATGYIFLLLRDLISIKLITIVLANTLILSGMIFLYLGVMRFLEKEENRIVIASILAAFILSFFYYTYFDDNISLRTAIVHAATATISFITARSLFLHKTHSINISAYLNTILFLMHGCFSATRAVVALTVDPVASLFTTTVVQTVSFFFSFVEGILLTFGLIIMVNQRSNAEMREAKDHFELIFNTNPDATIISRMNDGVIVDINDGFTSLTGFTRDEIIGKKSADINLLDNTGYHLPLINEHSDQGLYENVEVIFRRKEVQNTCIMSAKIILLQGLPHVIRVFRDITDRKRAEESQRETDEKYRWLMNNIADVISVLDMNLQFTYVSPSVMRVRGYTAEEAMAQTLEETLTPESLLMAAEVFDEEMKLDASGMADPARSRIMELAQYSKDGSIIWLENNLSIIRDASQKPVGISAVSRDITDRKRAEEALRLSREIAERLAEETAVIAEIGRLIGSTLDIEKVYERFAAESRKLIPFDRLAINLFNIHENTLTFAYVTGIDIPHRKKGGSHPLAGTLTAEVIRVRTGLIIQPESIDEIISQIPELLPTFQAGLRSLLCVPLISRDEVIGVLHFRTKKTNAYKEQDLHLAERIGAQIAGAIANAQMFNNLSKTEKSLRKSEEKFRVLFENAKDGIFLLSSNGEIVSVNAAFARMHGYTVEEMQMMGLKDLDSPKNGEAASSRLHRLFTEEIRSFEVEHTCKNGETIPLEVSANLVIIGDEKYILGFHRDITERRQVDEALRESEKRYKDFVENSFAGVYVVQDDCFVFLNNNAASFAGYKPEELIGRKADSIILPEDRKQVRDIAKKMLSRKDLSPYEFRILTKDGEIRWIIETVSQISFNGRPAIMGNCIDITERRHREVLEIHSRKLEAVGQLAAGIAHEINTPVQFVGDNIHFMKGAFQDILSLTSILDAVKENHLSNPAVAKDIISRIREKEAEIDLDFIREEIPKAIEQSLDGLQRVSRIVLAMREFSHPGVENKTNLNINKAIESTITLSRNEWKYSADLITTLAPDLPDVQCYPADFNQVILNLIVNAAHAVQQKFGKDGRNKGQIEISTRADCNEVEISIRDTGTGIPLDAQPRVFDPFFTTKEVGKGTGQGLAIAQNIIVRKHGGKLFFETKVGEGTIFYIRLPLDI